VEEVLVSWPERMVLTQESRSCWWDAGTASYTPVSPRGHKANKTLIVALPFPFKAPKTYYGARFHGPQLNKAT
jgi:hypothetical protein